MPRRQAPPGLPFLRRWDRFSLSGSGRTVRTVDLDDCIAPVNEKAGDSGTIRTCAFDPDCGNLSLVLGPPFQLPIAVRIRRCAAFAEADTLPVNSHRHVFILMSVDSDNHLNSGTAAQIDGYCHDSLLRECARLARGPGERSRLRWGWRPCSYEDTARQSR